MADALRILIVDDDPSIADILTPALTDHGYEVITALDGPEALDIINVAEPDLFLLDIMMPGMDGFELTQKIRQLPAYRNTPIMFLTALEARSDIQKAYSQGVTVYLTKPVSIDRLLRNLKVCEENDGLKPRRKGYSLEDVREAKSAFHPKPTAKSKPAPTPAPTPAPGRKSTPAPTPAPSAAEQTPRMPQTPAPTQTPPPSVAPTVAQTIAITPPTQLPRVMIVEDDSDVVEVMTVTLEQHFEVVTAFDGLDAVKKIEDMEPDMFIIDLMMPRLNGYQLIHSLHSSPTTSWRPILVVSAKSSRSDQRHAMAVGAHDFLAKPFQPEELLTRLHQLTQRPDFHVVSPKKKSLREIIQEETRRRLEEEELRKAEEARRQSLEEQRVDPFAQEEHVRQMHDVKGNFTDLKKVFKKSAKEK